MIQSTADTAQPPNPLAERQGPAEFVIRSVGVVGLGHMGHAFAVNLVEDGHQVFVYDRDPKRAAAVTGARAAAQLADLAACEVVMTSLPDDDAPAAVALGPEGLSVFSPQCRPHFHQHGQPGVSRRVAEEHARHRQEYVAAPVLGNPDFARERKLFVLAAGPHSAMEKVRPLLERLGQRLFIIGEDAALANLVKLAANVLTATTLECMGEVLALMRKGGVDAHLAYDVLTNSLFDSRVHKTYGGKIVDEHYSPGMAVPLAIKDMRLALAEADAPYRCRLRALFMTSSSQWWHAAGPGSTGRPSVCSRPSMRA